MLYTWEKTKQKMCVHVRGNENVGSHPKKGRPSTFVSSERVVRYVRRACSFTILSLKSTPCLQFLYGRRPRGNGGNSRPRNILEKGERGARKIGRPPLHYGRQSSGFNTREPALAPQHPQSGDDMELKRDDRVRHVLRRTRPSALAVLQRRHRRRGSTAVKHERVKLLLWVTPSLTRNKNNAFPGSASCKIRAATFRNVRNNRNPEYRM